MRHEYRIRIPSFLCRPDDRVGFDGMASLFQEAAWEHAGKLGVAFTGEETTFYWVLQRLGMRFVRPPRWGESIVIHTWPSRMVRLYAMREFVVRNEQGELLLEASSSWIILDAKTGRPVRPEQQMSREWTVAEVPLEMPTGKLPALATPQEELAAAVWDRVRPSDTDRNSHVNNARYSQWLSDLAPRTVTTDAPGLFTFTAETRAGQEFAVIGNDGPNGAGIAEVWVRDPGAELAAAICACRYNRLVPRSE